jgi:hypothetical protein
MRERSYIRRGRRAQLNELTDLVALHDASGREAPRLTSEIPESAARDLAPSAVEAFERAGWVFQPASARGVPEGVATAKVFLRPNGQLVLGTNILSVKLLGDPSVEEANVLLQPYGCQVLERLTFAPGLFRVAVTDETHEDALSVANRLVESKRAEFAEPELIEVTGHRTT